MRRGLAPAIGAVGGTARFGFARAGRRGLERDAGAAGLIEADGDGLAGRAGAVPAMADMINLLMNKFTGGGGRRLALAQIPLGIANGRF